MTSILPDTLNPATLLSRRFKPEEIPDLTGRVAIVTGGSAGIGYYDALYLAKANAKVIIVSADKEHGKTVEAEMKRALQEAGARGSVTWYGADFGTLKEVDAVAKKLAEQEERVDILICNAGVAQAPWKLTNDGLEHHFEINVLAHYVIVLRLLPLLRKTALIAPPTTVRVVMQSSELHRMAPSDTRFSCKEEINEQSDGTIIYGRSKLGMIYLARNLISRKLSDLPPDRPVLAISVHPGTVDTEVQSQVPESYGVLGKVAETVMRGIGKSAAEGAEASLWAATSTDIYEGNWKDFQGNYYSEAYGKPHTESALAKNDIVSSNFWTLCGNFTQEYLGERLE